MKIGADVLRRYIQLPETLPELRDLLDDVGVEVKRVEPSDYGPILSVELLANRGDHYCYEGIAREIAGRTGDGVILPPVASVETGESPYSVEIQTELCSLFSFTMLERTSEQSLSRDEALPLQCAGLGSVLPAVDATNLASIELGQPTHAFDADKLKGPVRVRLSRAGESAWPLFTEGPVPIEEGLMVIADDEKILAIAGVIGCEESKTTEETTRILLEAAAFDPVAVRKASRKMGIHTDASARFERGSDFSRVLVGAGRVVHLLERAGWERRGPTGMFGDWNDPNRIIALDVVAAAAFLEHPLTEAEARDRLVRYGFAVSPAWPDWQTSEGWAAPPSATKTSKDRLRHTLLVRVPPARLWDVEFQADLVEDLAKSIGYNDSPTRLPPVEMGEVPSHREAVRARAEEVLLGNGFYEVITNGFHGRDLRDKLEVHPGHSLYEHVETANALERAYSLLKNSPVGQAVEAVAANQRRQQQEVRAYEWTRVFLPDADARNGLCRERHVLWAIASGHDADPTWAKSRRPADAHFFAGLVAELGAELKLPLTLSTTSVDAQFDGLLHPGRRADIVLDRRVVGAIGEIHPGVRKRFKLGKTRPVYLEIDEDALQHAPEDVPYVEPSVHHDIVRNLAFTLPSGVFSDEVGAVLAGSAPSWFQGATVVDLYAHTEAGVAVQTLTYELRFAPGPDGRTAEEVNATCEHLVRVVGQRLGDRGVQLRG
ncbi:MAG: hypothetical protein KC912_12485 [Proteobacteria bacterium]|nr:hypothetical protein [Pseudomonadota bacterium]